MFFRRCAITVFVTLLTAASAHAEDLAERFKALQPPQPAPLFQFEDGKGGAHDLRDYKGGYVVLNLWATWCGPCVKEMPGLDALQAKLGAPVTVIALNEDRDGAALAQAFYARHDLKQLKVYVDNAGKAPSILHAPGLPVTLLIDPQGNEIGRVEGEADWSSPDSVAFLKTRMKL